MDSGFLRLIFAILLCSIPVVAVEFLLHKFTKHRIYKYILPALALLMGVGFIAYARFSHLDGFSDLAYVLLGVICFGIFVISLIAAIAFEKLLRISKK